MPYVTYSAKRRLQNFVSQRLSWSTLARLGRLPIIKASIFAPFVGYIILFNDYAIDFFNQVSMNISNVSQFSTIGGIYYTYFGLILIGIAQVFYALLCPSNISHYEDALRYSEAIRNSNKTLIADILDNVLSAFILNERNSEENERMNYPEKIRLLTSDLIERIYNSTDKSDWGEQFPNEDNAGPIPDMIMFTSGSGYLIAENIATAMYERPRAVSYYAEPLRDTAIDNFGYDISHLDFQVDDYRYPWVRFVCAVLYVLGTVLLTVPAAGAMLAIITSLV